MVDDGVKGALLVIGRSPPLNPGMGRRGDVLFQHLHQAGFANAGLAAEQYHLPHVCGGLVPPPLQEEHLFVPAYQRGQAAWRDDVESGLRPTLVQDPIDLERLGQAFERRRPERLTDKIAVDEVGSRRADDDRIRGCQALESCRNVRRLPQGKLLLPSTTADLADHHQPGVDTEPHRQAHPVRLLQARIQRPHGLDDPEPAAHGPLGLVFMSLGIAEVHEQTIPKVLGNMPIKALDDLSTELLIGAYHFPEVFRIQLASEGGRVHEVAEQHRELATFRVEQMWGVDSSSGQSSFYRRRRGRGDVLRQQRRGVGSRGHGRGTRPHQDSARLVHRQLLPIDEFVL
jgi:hypothetical protein